MKFNLSNEQINEVVAHECAPMSNDGLLIYSFLHDICREEEEEADPDMESELGFSTVDTVEKCISWLSW